MIYRQPLSEAELTVLRTVRDYSRRHRVPPTLEEIAKDTPRSKSTVRRVVARLIKKEMLQKSTGLFRNLVVTPQGFVAARKKPVTPKESK